jgi:serine/threonine protein kinase
MTLDTGSTTFTFDLRRQYTGLSNDGTELLEGSKCDLITFLSAAQTFNIPFVDITWQSALDTIGIGGTATIAQSQMSRDARLAYKRIKDEDKGDPDNVYRLLLSELSVLGHPAIRYHPNVIELLGIGWDVTSEDAVWPVLVFQKSHFGDLKSFAVSEMGRNLTLGARVEICGNIITAIASMHEHGPYLSFFEQGLLSQFDLFILGIIHGDLKPSNVLIFTDNEGGFFAKVADFGFSSCVSGETDKIFIPESWPWNAPEHGPVQSVSGRYQKDRAERMDMYSTGLICLWFLFEPYFAGIKPLPHEARWAEGLFVNAGKCRPTLQILECLKREKKALQLACELLTAEVISSNEPIEKEFWYRIFSDLLQDESEKRRMGLVHLLQILKSALRE